MRINRSKPVVTYAMLGACIVGFIIEIGFAVYAYGFSAIGVAISGSREMTPIYYILGAKENISIAQGQWWRLILPMFLHSGITHLLFNGFALFTWGRQAEAFLGRLRYLSVYLLAGIAGCCASFAFSSSLSVGASGAIFGIFGALLYFRTRHKEIFNRFFGTQVIIIIGINIFYGFTNGQVDNFGHLGGLAGGFLASCAAGLLGEKEITARKILAAAGYVVLFGGFLFFGFLRWS